MSSYAVVLTAGNDGQVRVWEVATGTCKRVFKGHNYPINCMMVSLNLKLQGLPAVIIHISIQVLENQVYSGSYDKTVHVWDISSVIL